MAVNVVKYMKNFGRSVAYSTVDHIKNNNEAIATFADSNKELGLILYKSVKDIKGTVAKGYDYVIKSAVGEAAAEYKKALFEDIKTGNFYNKERIAAMEMKAAGNLADFSDFTDDPFAELDFSDDDFFKDSGDDDLDSLIGDDDLFLADNMNEVGFETAKAINTGTARSAEYVVSANKKYNLDMMRHNEKMMSQVTLGIGAMNANISSLLKFNDDVMKTHVQNSSEFFTATTAQFESINKLAEERNKILNQILENQNKMFNTTQNTRGGSERISYSDITSGGMPNLLDYFKKIKSNANNMSGGLSDMINMFEGGNMLMAFAGSPLKFVTDNLVKAVIPKTLDKVSQEFGKSLEGYFGSTIMKLNQMADNDEGSFIGKYLGKLLGIELTPKGSIDTSKYNKGPMPWDGQAKKALTEVIPAQLSQIISILNGSPAKVYDFESGKFVDLAGYKKSYEESDRRERLNPFNEIINEFEKQIKNFDWDKSKIESLRKDWENMFIQQFNSGKLLDIRKGSAYELGIENSENLPILRAMIESLPRNMMFRANDRVANGINSMTSRKKSIETGNAGIEAFMYNNFIDRKDYKNGKYNPTNLLANMKDRHGRDIFYYMQNMYKELTWQRLNWQKQGGAFGGSATNSVSSIDDTNTRSIPLVTNIPQDQFVGPREYSNRRDLIRKMIEEGSDSVSLDDVKINGFNYKPNVKRQELSKEDVLPYKEFIKYKKLYDKFKDKPDRELSRRVRKQFQEAVTKLDRHYKALRIRGLKSREENDREYQARYNAEYDKALRAAKEKELIMARLNYRYKRDKYEEEFKNEPTTRTNISRASYTNSNATYFNPEGLSSIDSISIQDTDEVIRKRREENKYNDPSFERAREKNRSKAKEKMQRMLKEDVLYGDEKKAYQETLKALASSRENFDHRMNRLDEARDTESLGIFKRLLRSDNVSDKAKDVILGLDQLSKKPVTFLANLLHKADERMYEILYGTEQEKKNNPRSFMGNLMFNMKMTFMDMKNWMIDNIFDPIGEAILPKIGSLLDKLGFDEEKRKNLGKNIKNFIFGERNEEGELVHPGMFGGLIDFAEKSVKDVYNPLKSNLEGKRLTEEEYLLRKEFGDNNEEMNNMIKDFVSSVPQDRFSNMEERSKAFKEYKEVKDYRKMVSDKAAEKSAQARELKDPSKSAIDYSKAKFAPVFSERTGKIEQRLMNPEEAVLNISHRERFNELQEKKRKKLEQLAAKGETFAKDSLKRQDNGEGARFASGSPLITKTGLAVISEGEAIIPAELNPFNKSKKIDSLETQDKKEKSKLAKLKDLLVKYGDNGDLLNKNIPGFAGGTASARVEDGEVQDDNITSFENQAKQMRQRKKENKTKKNKTKSSSGNKEAAPPPKVSSTIYGELYGMTEEEVLEFMFGKSGDRTPVDVFETPEQFLARKRGKDYNKSKVVSYKEYKRKADKQKETKNTQQEEFEDPKYRKIGKYYYEKGEEPLIYKSFQELGNGVSAVFKAITDSGKDVKEKIDGAIDNAKVDNKENELFTKVIDDVYKKGLRDYLPVGLGGAILGSGVSLVTGAIGGPLVGAAVGAALNITKESQAVQNWLFGERDKNGERTGNVLSMELSRNIDKYFPDMAKGAVVGGITSILPFVPGGPVAGIVLGSAIGFAKNNQKIMDNLFGREMENGERDDSGLIKPATLKKIEKAFPRMGAGAIAGVIGGPFGLVGNILLGSALGYATTTDKFKEAIFGKEDADGNKQGGLLPTLKQGFVDPLVDFAKDSTTKLKEWFKKDIMDPITGAIKPIAKQLSLAAGSIFALGGRILENIFEKKIGVPLGKFFEEKVMKRLLNATTSITKFLMRPTARMMALPSKAIGAIGERFKRRQIAKGNADYMTARERLEYRDEVEKKAKERTTKIPLLGMIGYGANRLFNGKIKGDKTRRFDEILATSNSDQLKEMQEALGYLTIPDRGLKAEKNKATDDLNRMVTYDYGLSYDEAQKLLKKTRKGGMDSAKKYIEDNLFFDGDYNKKQKFTRDFVEKYSKVQATEMVSNDTKGYKARLSDRLRRLGLGDIDLNDSRSVQKYKNLVDKEVNNKSIEEITEENNQSRHNELMDALTKGVDYLRQLVDPEYRKKVRKFQTAYNAKKANARRSIFGTEGGSQGLYDNLTEEEIQHYRDEGLWEDGLDQEAMNTRTEDFRSNSIARRVYFKARTSLLARGLSQAGRRLTGQHLFGKIEENEWDRARREAKGNKILSRTNIERIRANYLKKKWEEYYTENPNGDGSDIDFSDAPDVLKRRTGEFDYSRNDEKYRIYGKEKAEEKLRGKTANADEESEKKSEEAKNKKKKNSKKSKVVGDNKEYRNKEKDEDMEENSAMEDSQEDSSNEPKKRGSKFKFINTLYGRKKYKQDAKSGEYDVDESDQETKETEKAQKEQNGLFVTMKDSIVGLAGTLTDGFNRFFGIQKEEDSWRKKLLKIGLGIAGGLTVLGGISRLNDWWGQTVTPALKQLFSPIAPLIAQTATSLAIGIDNIVLSIPSKIDMLKNSLVNAITVTLPNFFKRQVLPLWAEGFDLLVNNIAPKVMHAIGYALPFVLEKMVPPLLEGAMDYLTLRLKDLLPFGNRKSGNFKNATDYRSTSTNLVGLSGNKDLSLSNTEQSGPMVNLLKSVGLYDANTAAGNKLNSFGDVVSNAQESVGQITNSIAGKTQSAMNSILQNQYEGDMNAIVGGYGYSGTFGTGATESLSGTNIESYNGDTSLSQIANETAQKMSQYKSATVSQQQQQYDQPVDTTTTIDKQSKKAQANAAIQRMFQSMGYTGNVIPNSSNSNTSTSNNGSITDVSMETATGYSSQYIEPTQYYDTSMDQQLYDQSYMYSNFNNGTENYYDFVDEGGFQTYSPYGNDTQQQGLSKKDYKKILKYYNTTQKAIPDTAMSRFPDLVLRNTTLWNNSGYAYLYTTDEKGYLSHKGKYILNSKGQKVLASEITIDSNGEKLCDAKGNILVDILGEEITKDRIIAYKGKLAIIEAKNDKDQLKSSRFYVAGAYTGKFVYLTEQEALSRAYDVDQDTGYVIDAYGMPIHGLYYDPDTNSIVTEPTDATKQLFGETGYAASEEPYGSSLTNASTIADSNKETLGERLRGTILGTTIGKSARNFLTGGEYTRPFKKFLNKYVTKPIKKKWYNLWGYHPGVKRTAVKTIHGAGELGDNILYGGKNADGFAQYNKALKDGRLTKGKAKNYARKRAETIYEKEYNKIYKKTFKEEKLKYLEENNKKFYNRKDKSAIVKSTEERMEAEGRKSAKKATKEKLQKESIKNLSNKDIKNIAHDVYTDRGVKVNTMGGSKVTTKLGDAVDAVDSVTRTLTTPLKGAGNLAYKGASKVSNALDSMSSKITKMMLKPLKLITDLIMKIPGLKSTLELTKSKVDDLLQKFSAKLVNNVMKNGAESALGKLGQKIAAGAAKAAPFVNIALYVNDFRSGYSNAESIMGVTKCSFIEKVACGLFNLLYQLPIFIPFQLFLDTATIFDIFLSVASNIPLFKEWASGIKARQSEAAEELLKYNIKNHTNLTLEQYNKKDKITTKAWNSAKSFGKNLKSSIFGSDVSDEEYQKQIEAAQDKSSSAETLRSLSDEEIEKLSDEEKSAIIDDWNKWHDTNYTSFDEVYSDFQKSEEETKQIADNYKKKNTKKGLLGSAKDYIKGRAEQIKKDKEEHGTLYAIGNQYVQNFKDVGKAASKTWLGKKVTKGVKSAGKWLSSLNPFKTVEVKAESDEEKIQKAKREKFLGKKSERDRNSEKKAKQLAKAGKKITEEEALKMFKETGGLYDLTVSGTTLRGMSDTDIANMTQDEKVRFISQWNTEHGTAYTDFDEIIKDFYLSESENKEYKKLMKDKAGKIAKSSDKKAESENQRSLVQSMQDTLTGIMKKARKNLDKVDEDSDSALGVFNRSIGRLLGFHDDEGNPLSVTEMAKSTLDAKNPSEAMFYMTQVASLAGGVFGAIANNARKWFTKAKDGITGFFSKHNPVKFVKNLLGLDDSEVEKPELTVDADSAESTDNDDYSTPQLDAELSKQKTYRKNKSVKYNDNYLNNNSGFYHSNTVSAMGSGLVKRKPKSAKGTKKSIRSNKITNKVFPYGTNAGVSRRIPKSYTLRSFSAGSSSNPTWQDYLHENLGSWSPVTVEQMNAWIHKKSPNGPFDGHGDVFIKAANLTGLDPRYILAHAAIESGWGKSNIARDKNNYFGIMAYDDSPYTSAKTFSSGLEKGICEGAAWIRTNYYDKGQRTIYLMNHDPNGKGHNYATDPSWHEGIAKTMANGPANTKIVKENTALAQTQSLPVSTDATRQSLENASSSNPSGPSEVFTKVASDIAEAYNIFLGFKQTKETTETASTDSSQVQELSNTSTVDQYSNISSEAEQKKNNKKSSSNKKKNSKTTTKYTPSTRPPSTKTRDDEIKDQVKKEIKKDLKNKGIYTGATSYIDKRIDQLAEQGYKPKTNPSSGSILTSSGMTMEAKGSELRENNKNYMSGRYSSMNEEYDKYNNDLINFKESNDLEDTDNKKKYNRMMYKAKKQKYGIKQYGNLYENYIGNDAVPDSAGSSFISQLDPTYASKRFGDDTIGDAGCGPATATMALQDLGANISMDEATNLALTYKDENGTQLPYFKDIFEKYGANVDYRDDKSAILQDLKDGKQVVMMGQDPYNTSKSKSPYGPGAHYVLASGLDENGNIIVKDPEQDSATIYDQSILNKTTMGVGVADDETYLNSASVSGAGSKIRKVLSAGASKNKVTNTKGEAIKAKKVKVTSVELNYRSGPANTYKIKGKYKKGQIVTVDRLADDWYRVKGKNVWINKNYVVDVAKHSTKSIQETTANNIDYSAMTEVSEGIKQLAAYWSGVEYTPSTTTSTSSTIVGSTGSAGTDVVAIARSYIGKVTYVFGAASPDSGKSDCSGFTQHCYNKVGVSIGRDTRTQVTKGTKISKDQLQPGDLVFFQGTYRAGVSHVGIYSGNGKFIHCSSSAGVTESDLSSDYYTSHWMEARRVLSSSSTSSASGSKVAINKYTPIQTQSTKHKRIADKVSKSMSAGSSKVNVERSTNNKNTKPKNYTNNEVTKATATTNTFTSYDNQIIELMKLMVKMLQNISNNSDQVSEIIKLLSKILGDDKKSSKSAKGTNTQVKTSERGAAKQVTAILNKYANTGGNDVSSLISELESIIAQ